MPPSSGRRVKLGEQGIRDLPCQGLLQRIESAGSAVYHPEKSGVCFGTHQKCQFGLLEIVYWVTVMVNEVV
jgi:hypothetical protein